MHYLLRVLPFFIFIQIFNTLQAVEDWERVYLATYPRAGNHWLRSLLEEATHVATSSVYCGRNPPHLKTPFPWGGYVIENGNEGNCRYANPGEVIVIKTHYPAKRLTPYDLKPAFKIIRMVRHPLDSFYSHYLYQGKKLPADGKIPSWFVKRSIRNWKKFESYWNHQPHVLTIRYEDFFNNPHFYFKEILDAMGYSVSQEDINRAIAKFPPQGGVFKHLNDYHFDDLKAVEQELGRLMKKYNYELLK